MELNYNLFNTHIKDFDSSIYNEKLSKDNLENHFIFYQIYKKLIHSEIEKTKQLNAKFSKSIFEKNNKHNKINRNNSYGSEFKKVCSFESIDDEDERLNIIIRTYLNKISNDTFDKVSDQLIEKLLEIKNMNIFKILSEEIVNKCIYDNKYRNIYINLCSKIWNNKTIHYNLIEVKKYNNNEYIAEYNIDDYSIGNIGPFYSLDKLKEHVFKQINFKNYFIDFLQESYYKKDLDIENLEDNQFFDIKKKTLLLVELLSILFIEKHINFDIINLIIIDLLHQNNNFNEIKEIEFELLYVMIKFIYENNKNFKFIEYKKIIEKFKQIINSLMNNNVSILSKRSLYFMEEISNIFNKILNNERFDKKEKLNKKNENNLELESDSESKNNIEFIMINIEKGNIDNFSYIFEKLDKNNKEKIITIFINKILEKKNNQHFIKSLNSIKKTNIEFIEFSLEKIMNNLDDIILDIPDICENLRNFINELEIKEKFEILLNEKMKFLNNDSSDEESIF